MVLGRDVQGSILRQLLFAIYIKDIKNLDLFGEIFLYADDICLFYPFKYGTSARPYIERDSALILEFMRINRLFINERKTELIRFRPYKLSDVAFTVNIGGNLITEVDSVKYLGLHLQSNMSWDQHIRHLKSKIAPFSIWDFNSLDNLNIL
ncbi:uncharacterized protein LOC142235699 [Haematobia irritans]|uniref:uncharacterized protein LOC142235699 n=1 Tax=Haematobia irritans TaxID=7368 RepID=UPI003F4FB9A8